MQASHRNVHRVVWWVLPILILVCLSVAILNRPEWSGLNFFKESPAGKKTQSQFQ